MRIPFPENMNANQRAIFEKAQEVLRGVTGGKPLSSELPSARVCSSKQELGDWFAQFGRACRAAIPVSAT